MSNLLLSNFISVLKLIIVTFNHLILFRGFHSNKSNTTYSKVYILHSIIREKYNLYSGYSYQSVIDPNNFKLKLNLKL